MRRLRDAGVDERIQPLNDKLRAGEAKEGVNRGRKKRDDDGCPEHCGCCRSKTLE